MNELRGSKRERSRQGHKTSALRNDVLAAAPFFRFFALLIMREIDTMEEDCEKG